MTPGLRTGLALMALAVADSAQAKPPPEIPLEEGTNDAVVYVYRTQHTPAWFMRGAMVEVDGRKVANLPYNGCTAVRVPAGERVVGVAWTLSVLTFDLAREPVETATVLEPGGRYYYEFGVGSGPGRYYNEIEVRWSIQPTSDVDAVRPIAKCFFVKPRKDWASGPVRSAREGPKVANRAGPEKP